MQGSTDYSTGVFLAGFFNYACLLSRQRLLHWRNSGVSGNTTTQMVARFASDVIAYSPDICLILGGANDVGSGFVAINTFRNLMSMAEMARAAGIEPVLCTMLPRADGDATVLSNAQRLNVLLRNHDRIVAPRRGYHVLDLWSVVADPISGSWNATLTADNLHPNEAGCKALGQYVADHLASLVPDRTPYLTGHPSDPVNMLANGTFATDSNADGIADSWTASSTGGTVTYSLEVDATAGKRQRLTVTGNGQKFVSQSLAAASGKWAAGDRLAFAGRVTATLAAGAMTFTGEVVFSGASSGAPRLRVMSGFTKDLNDVTFYGEAVVPPGTTSVVVQFYNSTTGTGVIDLSQITLTNLTQLGLS